MSRQQTKKKRKVVNLTVGALRTSEASSEKYLLNMSFVKETNSTTITQCVTDSLNILWPDGIKYNQFLLLVTDAAPYMGCAGQTLCGTYPKLTHITCVAHGLHNVCDYLVEPIRTSTDSSVVVKKYLKSALRESIVTKICTQLFLFHLNLISIDGVCGWKLSNIMSSII